MNEETSTYYGIALNAGANAEQKFTGLFLPSNADDPFGRTIAEITELGLERNAWELDTLGYTVVTPQQVGAGDLAIKLREKLLDFAEQGIGFRPDLETDERM